jgi:hypothetical protein
MQYSAVYLDKMQPLFSEDGIRNRAVVETVNSLMLATGIYKLFTKADFKIFFERLHLISIHYNMIDRFFLNDNLFFIIYKGKIYNVALDDIINCIGIMSGTSPRATELDASWLNKIQQRVNDSIFEALDNRLVLFIKDVEVKSVIANGRETFDLIFKNNIKKINEEDIKNGVVLAESMLKDISDSDFEIWAKKYPDAINIYSEKLKMIKDYPHFLYSDLSASQLKKVNEHFSKFQLSDVFDVRRMILYTHLAWAWANGFVFYDEHRFPHVEEFVWLDSESLHLEGGGCNFEEIKEQFDLEELFEVLKVN